MPVIAYMVGFAALALTAMLTSTGLSLSSFHGTASKLSEFDTTSLAASSNVANSSNTLLHELKSSLEGTLNGARHVCTEGWETEEYFVQVLKTRTVKTPIHSSSAPSVNSSTGHVNYNPYAGYNQPSSTSSSSSSSSSSNAAAKAKFKSKFKSPQQYRRFKQKLIQKKKNKASLIDKLLFAPVSASIIRYEYTTETYYDTEKRTRQVCKGWNWVFPEGEKFRRVNAVNAYLNSVITQSDLKNTINFGLNHGEVIRHKGEPEIHLIHSGFLPLKTDPHSKSLASTMIKSDSKFTRVNPHEHRSFTQYTPKGQVTVIEESLFNSIVGNHPNAHLLRDENLDHGILIDASGISPKKLPNGVILDIETNIQKLNDKNELIPNSEAKIQKISVAQLRFEKANIDPQPPECPPPSFWDPAKGICEETKYCRKESTNQTFELRKSRDGICYDTNGTAPGCACYDKPKDPPVNTPVTTPSPSNESKKPGTGPVDLSIDKLPSDIYKLNNNNGGAVISKEGGGFRGLNVENGELIIRIGDKFEPCNDEKLDEAIALGTVTNDEASVVGEGEVSTGISMMDTVNASNTYGKLRKDLEIEDQNLLKSLIFSFSRLSLDSSGKEKLTIPSGAVVELTTNNREKLLKRDFRDLSDFNLSFYDNVTGELIVSLDGSNQTQQRLINGLSAGDNGNPFIDTSISRPNSRTLTNCGTGRIHSEVNVSDLFDTGSNGDATLAYANMRTSKKRSSQAATLLNNTGNFRQEVFSKLDDNFGGSLINIDLVKVAEDFFRKNGEAGLDLYLEKVEKSSFENYYNDTFFREFTDKGITLTREQKDEWELGFFQGVLRNIGLSNLSKNFLEIIESYLTPVQAIVANSDPTLECLMEDQEAKVAALATIRNKRDKIIEKRIEDIIDALESDRTSAEKEALIKEQTELDNVLSKRNINEGKKDKNGRSLPVHVQDWNEAVDNIVPNDIKEALGKARDKDLKDIYEAVNHYKKHRKIINGFQALCRR